MVGGAVGGCTGPEYYDGDRERPADNLLLRVEGETFVDARSQGEVAAVRDSFFVDTGIFPIEVAENNFFNRFVEVEGGFWPEAYNVGYYIALSLPVGRYTVEFGGGYADEFSNSVTARIEVVPCQGRFR
jgi:hypothetical protein